MLIVRTVDMLAPLPVLAMRFRNYYECTHDGTRWQDEWACMCNDRCPTCNVETEPHFSEELEVN